MTKIAKALLIYGLHMTSALSANLRGEEKKDSIRGSAVDDVLAANTLKTDSSCCPGFCCPKLDK